MKQEVWYNSKFNCFGILTIYRESTDFGFEIETKSGPVINLDKWLLPDWVLVGVL